jgi:hypothetical protein
MSKTGEQNQFSPAMSYHCRVASIPKIRSPLKVFKTNSRLVYGHRSIESSGDHPIACIDVVGQ